MNKVVFEGKLLVSCGCWLVSMLAANLFSGCFTGEEENMRIGAPVDARWVPLSSSLIKVNSGAAYIDSGEAGMGFLACNGEDLLLAVGCGPLLQASSSLMGETICFCWMIGLAFDLRFRRVVFETDCRLLVNAWLKSISDVTFGFE